MTEYTADTDRICISQTIESPLFQEINYYKRSACWGRTLHSHENLYQFLMVLSGSLCLDINGSKKIMNSGDISIIAPGVPHIIYTDTGYEQIGTNLEADKNKDVIGLIKLLQEYVDGSMFSSLPHLLPKAERLVSYLENSSCFAHTGACLLINQLLFQVLEETVFAKSLRFDKELSRYLDDHLAEKFSVQEVSEHFHISVSHLERLTKRFFGVGVKTLHSQKRLAHALDLLLHTELPVSEISHRVGFSETANFSAFISHHKGKSPNKLRQEAISSTVITE